MTSKTVISFLSLQINIVYEVRYSILTAQNNEVRPLPGNVRDGDGLEPLIPEVLLSLGDDPRIGLVLFLFLFLGGAGARSGGGGSSSDWSITTTTGAGGARFLRNNNS